MAYFNHAFVKSFVVSDVVTTDGNATSAFSAGGNRGPANTNATEEWTAANFQIKTVTTS